MGNDRVDSVQDRLQMRRPYVQEFVRRISPSCLDVYVHGVHLIIFLLEGLQLQSVRILHDPTSCILFLENGCVIGQKPVVLVK